MTNHLFNVEFEALHIDLNKGSLSVQIATLDSFGLPPSYAVQIGFGKGSRKIKEAEKSPGTWNERYIIHAALENSAGLSESLKTCLHDLNEERTTMLVIYTSCEMKLPIGDQAKIIVDTLLKCYKIDFLEEVVIVVPDESGLANVQARLQLQKATRLPKAASKQTQITKLKLIGLNAENVAGAKTSISRLMSRIYRENQDVVLKESCSDASHQSISKDSKKNKIEGDPLQHTDEVSAEINSGLIVCLDKSQILQTWIGKVELFFRIKIITVKQKVSVVGDFESILRFEKYLETEFPKYPDECCLDRTDESSLNETNEKYSSFELSADKCEESPSEIERYMVGCVSITLQTQDLQKTPSKCIAIPCCDCSTKAKNILNQLEAEIGRIPHLETAVEKVEPLKPLECRFFENTFGIPEVVLIYIPPHSDRGVYKNALAKMFQEVTDKNLDSVMLYLLNPEETDCPDEDYLDAYAQSIHQIAKSNTCLREIAVVNSDQSLLKTAKLTFDHKILSSDKTHSAPSATDEQKRNLKSNGVIVSGSKSRLYVAIGKLFEETCDVLVCFVNEKFEYIGPDGPKLYELAPDSYKRYYDNELKTSHWKQAVEISCKGGNLRSHFVIHVIMKAIRPAIIIRQNIQRAIIQAQEKNMHSVAIPVLRTDNLDDNPIICEETIHGVIEACRSEQLREQEMRIHILATDDESLDSLMVVTNKSQKIVTHGQTKNIDQ